MKTNLSDDEILQLWRSPTFSGSYRGIKTFKLLLFTDKNIDISEKRLYTILKNDPIFLIHQKAKPNFQRRTLDVTSYGEMVQADLAEMFEFNNYKYFLLLVDAYSSKVFVRPLKTKSSATVASAFSDIFNEFKGKIYKLETDSGREFLGACKALFKQKRIIYKSKFGKNKLNTYSFSAYYYEIIFNCDSIFFENYLNFDCI